MERRCFDNIRFQSNGMPKRRQRDKKKEEICWQTKPGFTFNLSLFACSRYALLLFNLTRYLCRFNLFRNTFFWTSQAINNFSLDLLFLRKLCRLSCLFERSSWMKVWKRKWLGGRTNELDDPTRQVGDKAFCTGTHHHPNQFFDTFVMCSSSSTSGNNISKYMCFTPSCPFLPASLADDKIDQKSDFFLGRRESDFDWKRTEWMIKIGECWNVRVFVCEWVHQ